VGQKQRRVISQHPFSARGLRSTKPHKYTTSALRRQRADARSDIPPPAAMGMHAFLKNILKLTNSLLLVLGLFMGLFSLYLTLQFRKERRATEAGRGDV